MRYIVRAFVVLAFGLPFCAGVSRCEANPLRNLELGAAAFPFSLPDTNGNAVSLDKFKGRPVVVCYWREGQFYSKKMLEVMTRAQAKFGGKGVEFLSITRTAGAEAPKVSTMPFPVLLDDQEKVYGDYGLFILPTTFVLDGGHRLKAYFSSYQEESGPELDKILSEMLGLKATPAPAPRYAAVQGMADPELNLARELLKEGKAAEALPLLEKGLRGAASGDAAELKLLSAQALMQLSRLEEAKARLEGCLKDDPASHEAQLLLGRTLFLMGRYEPAEEALKKSMGLNPHSEKAHYYLGELYEKTGRKDLALAEYRAALERIYR
ncbi:MAG: tetratricopeptide repeat protein [Elusimicrobia bacterium]|nr:tetratricopeptide repeat protein [Elusimicrobiota bacterium]